MSQNRAFKIPRTNALVAISLYILMAIAVFIYGTTTYNSDLIHNFSYLIFGLLIFTLAEYAFHRFLYHSGDNYKDEKNWQFTIHGVHHVHPKDSGLLAMPIPLAILLASIFFLIFYLILGNDAFFFWPGFFIGYATYLYIHHKVHTSKPPKNIFKYLWRHHLLHHYSCENKAFGVSSPLWDFIFRTMPPKKRSTANDK